MWCQYWWLGKAGIGLKSTWQYVEGLPDPSNGASFSTGNSAAFTAVFDKTNMIQKQTVLNSMQVPMKQYSYLYNQM